MDLKEFERQILTGEITDFEPYFAMADEDELIELKRICIHYDVYTEKYHEWARNHNDYEYNDDLQYMLLERGYCLDVLIFSHNRNIRAAVIEKDIRYALEWHILEDDKDLIFDALMEVTEPDGEVLHAYIEVADDNYALSALKLKQKAMNMEPSTLERTMSPLQLFEHQNPLWTTGLSGYDVINVGHSVSPKETLEKLLKEKDAQR